MDDAHTFEATVRWPADPAQPKPPAPAFSRDAVLGSPGHADIAGSSPTAYGGTASRYNPEELITLAASECHMLTYLALAAKRRVAVLAYEDRATGTLAKGPSGKLQVTHILLRPKVTLATGSDLADANAMHQKAHAHCFISSSVNFPVEIAPEALEG
jgi:organic hydroperoxide reductase OsmC/OhrA